MLALTRSVVRESRIDGLSGFDAAGAVTVTGGLALLVYAVSKAPTSAGRPAATIGLLVASRSLLLAFFAIERRGRSPLVPLQHLPGQDGGRRQRVGLLLGAVVFANFFLLTLYVQQVLGYSAAEDRADVPLHGRHGGASSPGCRRR